MKTNKLFVRVEKQIMCIHSANGICLTLIYLFTSFILLLLQIRNADVLIMFYACRCSHSSTVSHNFCQFTLSNAFFATRKRIKILALNSLNLLVGSTVLCSCSTLFIITLNLILLARSTSFTLSDNCTVTTSLNASTSNSSVHLQSLLLEVELTARILTFYVDILSIFYCRSSISSLDSV